MTLISGLYFTPFSVSVLCVSADSHEVFLLGAAALANITFMDNMACDYLLQYNTARVLIESCQQEKAQSLFAKDQVRQTQTDWKIYDRGMNFRKWYLPYEKYLKTLLVLYSWHLPLLLNTYFRNAPVIFRYKY